jgi:uncharacterized protein with PIN domain
MLQFFDVRSAERLIMKAIGGSEYMKQCEKCGSNMIRISGYTDRSEYLLYCEKCGNVAWSGTRKMGE